MTVLYETRAMATGIAKRKQHFPRRGGGGDLWRDAGPPHSRQYVSVDGVGGNERSVLNGRTGVLSCSTYVFFAKYLVQ